MERDRTMLHSLWRNIARENASLPAVIDWRGEWTYGALTRAVDGIKQRLISHVSGDTDLVTIVGPPSFLSVAALLAVLESGRAFNFQDPTDPPERVANILKLISAKIAIYTGNADAQLSAVVAKLGATRVVDVSDLAHPFFLDSHGHSPETLAVQAPESIAAIYMTSGSTGWPKAAALSHRACSATLDRLRSDFSLGCGKRVFGQAPLCFDISYWSVFIALESGGVLALPTAEVLSAPDASADFIRRWNLDYVNSVPSYLAHLLSASSLPEHPLPLKDVVLCGETLPMSLVREMRLCMPGGARIWNQFGSTETPHIGFFDTADASENDIRFTLTMDMSITVDGPELDGTGRLRVKGPCLFSGYLENGKLSDTSRIDNLTGYLSRDLGRLDEEGRLHFGGRIDRIVKYEGFLVNLVEIENTLGDYRSIQGVVAVVLEGPTEIGALIEAESKSLTKADVLSYASTVLPLASRPTVVSVVRNLPRNSSGKIDTDAALRLLSASRTV